MKSNKVFQFLIFLFLLILLLNSSYNYILNNFIIKTEILQETTYHKGYDTTAYIFYNEVLLKARNEGTFKPLVNEGDRIGRQQPLGQIGSRTHLSPISGIVSYKYDKLEEASDPFESSSFNLQAIKEFHSDFDNSDKDYYLEGEIVLKIRDNLAKAKIYLELPIDSFKEPIKEGEIIKLKLVNEEDPLRARVTNLKGLGQKAILLLEFIDSPEETSRFEEVKIITEEIKTYLVPQKALVKKNDSIGLYQVSKGLLIFKEINFLGQDEDHVFTDSFDRVTEIISNPRFAREGRYIR